MSHLLRKRHFSDTCTAKSIKFVKLDQSGKENILPALIHNHDRPDIKKEISTPKKNSNKSKEQPVTPSTNFKLLASLAADLDYVSCTTPISSKRDDFESQISCDSDHSELSASKVINRKEKSLGIICTRFMAMYPLYPNADEKIVVSLDEACTKLGVERRRLYDIVNVFESIDILTKNAKNQYLWFGKNNLLRSLRNLKAAAIRENFLEKLQYVMKIDSSSCKSSCILNDVKNFNEFLESPDSLLFSSTQASCLELRKEKSLGIVSQKFLMLFLVSSDKIISLGVAAKVLNGFNHRVEKGAQIKTQIRRLYDVANVLSSIGLIQKDTAFSSCGRKPAFKYIGPDLKDHEDKSCRDDSLNSQSTLKGGKNRSLARHSSFQEICAVAEIEHQKLNLKEPHNSAPPFDSALMNEKGDTKTSFENLQLNNELRIPNTKSNNDSKLKVPVLVKQHLKVLNLKKPTENPAIPYFIINSLPAEKPEVKCTTSSYGTQTFLLINTTAPSRNVKSETSGYHPVPKMLSPQTIKPIPQTIKLSLEQRDAILQSLNISLSSEQIAAIHLDGSSLSNSQNASCNTLKIINKNSLKTSENKTLVKVSLQKDTELNSNGSTSVNNTRSNTPNSMPTLDSPFSMPSGYVTPIPNVSSDISFASTVEVNDILKKIENQASNQILNSKVTVPKQLNANSSKETMINSATEYGIRFQNTGGKEKLVSNGCSTTCSENQVHQLISNDSCSSDSVNLELSNIFKGRNLGDTSVKPKPFLIDEKTLLSPIKTINVPGQISVPSNLITPPYAVPETVFLFNSTVYQTAKVNNIPNFVATVPNILTERKKILPINLKLDN